MYSWKQRCDSSLDGVALRDIRLPPESLVAFVIRGGESLFPTGGTTLRAGDEILEVKSGLFGLGKHYYIPLSAIQEVLTDSVFLTKSREAFEELGYTEKPAHLAVLH